MLHVPNYLSTRSEVPMMPLRSKRCCSFLTDTKSSVPNPLNSTHLEVSKWTGPQHSFDKIKKQIVLVNNFLLHNHSVILTPSAFQRDKQLTMAFQLFPPWGGIKKETTHFFQGHAVNWENQSILDHIKRMNRRVYQWHRCHLLCEPLHSSPLHCYHYFCDPLLHLINIYIVVHFSRYCSLFVCISVSPTDCKLLKDRGNLHHLCSQCLLRLEPVAAWWVIILNLT